MTTKYLAIALTIVVCTMAIAFTAKKKQGLQGYIYFVSGNRMPSPDRKTPDPKGISTTLYIYELTNKSQVETIDQGAFYKSVSTKLVKTVQSDDKGYFKVKLPAGDYSLFTKKDSVFYANIFDGNNNIAPVKVEPGKFTDVKVNVDYDAVY